MPFEEKKKHIEGTNMPLVSIITPLYNAASFVSETINSVLQQTYQNWELLIVDDASTDNSVCISEAFAAKEPRIRLLKNNKNKGAAYCRNQATELAKGDYIAFLDADDLWFPKKLEKQIQFMQKAKATVSFTSYMHIDETGKYLHKNIIAMPRLTYAKQHTNNYIGNLTGVYHAAVLGKIIAPKLEKRQDWAVWLEAIKRSDSPALGIQEILAKYRVHASSMSANKSSLLKHNFNFYRKHLGYSWLTSTCYLGRFMWEYFMVRPKFIEKTS